MTAIQTSQKLIWKDPRQEDAFVMLDTRTACEDDLLGETTYDLTIGELDPMIKVDFTHVASRDESKPINQDILPVTIQSIRKFARTLHHAGLRTYGQTDGAVRQMNDDFARYRGEVASLDVKIQVQLDEKAECESEEKYFSDWDLKKLQEKRESQWKLAEQVRERLDHRKNNTFYPELVNDIRLFADDADGFLDDYFAISRKAEIVGFARGEILAEEDAADEEYFAEIGGEKHMVFSLYAAAGETWHVYDEKTGKICGARKTAWNSSFSEAVVTLTIKEMLELAVELNSWCNIVEGRELELRRSHW